MNMRQIFKEEEEELVNEFEEALESKIDEKVNSIFSKPLPFKKGKTYIFRTDTMCNVGKVKEIIGDFITITEAYWVADTGKWSDCLKTGKFNAIEPFEDEVYLYIPKIIDATRFNHKIH